MLRIVIDTNVYISAILFGGKPETILDPAKSSKIELLVSEDILAEVARVLKRKFEWSDWQIATVLEEIKSLATLVTPQATLQVIKADEADNRFLECALAGGAQYLVSGDERHLLPLEQYKQTRIVSPAKFLSLLDL